ncbi:MAG: polyprenyl synthetase family protein [Planctomycetota bacterium]
MAAPSGAEGPPEFERWLAARRAEFEAALSVHLKEIEAAASPHTRLPAAVVYSVRLGGKRFRPILVLECCRVCGGDVEHALPAAIAMECVHAFSLIHDDLPAMDNDDFRRGQPTNHKVFGEGLAVLAGDWLVTHAFGLLANAGPGPAVVPELLRTLAEGTQRMILGQGADIESEGRPADAELVRYIHQHKTAALIESCCRLGALCAGAGPEQIAPLAEYGHRLGVAFQIMDDVLDVTSSAAKMGKRVGKDAAATKQTYPAAVGLEESRAEADREVTAALAALAPFGRRADRLRDLARYVIQRDH